MPVPPEVSPYRAFDRIFGQGFMGMGNVASAERLRLERKSVIDLVKAEISDFSTKIGKADRDKISAHLEATRSIEQRLQMVVPQTSCAQKAPSGMINIDANDNYPMISRLQLDLAVAALACDRTRIITFAWSREAAHLRYTWIAVTGEHHNLSHDTGQKAQLSKITRYYAGEMAYLLDKMKKIPDGTGSLLDNSLVYWSSGLYTGWDHSPTPNPAVLFGRCGGALRTGRFLNLTGAYHSQMLVSMCQAMGATAVTKVGDLGMGGPLPGLLG